MRKIVSDADERFVNFLELLAERHRMPALFRIRREFDALWAEENKLLPVTVTSAVELDEGLVEDIGKRIEEQTGRTVELSSNVDPDVLGGLMVQVGNMVLDATVRNRLERLRKQVAKSDLRRPDVQIKPDEITSILKSRIEGLEDGGADLSEVGTVLSVADGISRVHGLDNVMSSELLELPHDVTGLALNLESDNVGAVLFGPWDEIEEGDQVKRTGRLLQVPSATRCSAASSTRSAARSTARATSTPTRRARPSSRPPAWCTASR